MSVSEVTFSIVIPVFNRADSIGPTLQSVKQQTFGDFECLIVDDGSKDGEDLVRVVDALNDTRFRLIRRENGGGGAARNTGIDAATGRFIAFLDSDDQFHLDKLERDHALLMQQDDPRGTVVFAQVELERGLGRRWLRPSRAPYPNESMGDYLMRFGGFTAPTTMVVPTILAHQVRFDPLLPYGQDTDFAIRLDAAGARWIMHANPTAVMDDNASPNRISLQKKYQPLLEWTDRLRPLISRKAYLAYRGLHIARIASRIDPALSTRLYFEALFAGAFTAKGAIRAGLQILLPPSSYRGLSTLVIRLFGRP